MQINNKNRRGQVSDSISWVVATLVIVGILGVFIFISSSIAKARDLVKDAQEVFSEEDSFNLVDVKNEISFKVDSSNKDKILEWLNDEG